MLPDHSRSHFRRGSALLLVLWCVVLLGLAVFGVVEMVGLSAEHTARNELSLEARALAASGVALGLHPQLLKDDPLLAQTPAPGRQFKAIIQGEGARLNLNYILLTNHREILVNLFIQWGLKIADATRVADCLYDWVTPGDLRSPSGAKAQDYIAAGLRQVPTGQPFRSFDEVGQVMWMDMVAKTRPNWQDSFTLWSSGPLDVNEAPAELIAAVFGLLPDQLQNFIVTRNGPDGIPGTLDDVPVPNMPALQSQLSLSDAVFRPLTIEVALADPMIRRVVSTGRAGGMQVTLTVVARMGTSPIQYLLWSEY